MTNTELDHAKLQLKVQAQRERISELEDQVADLRVDLTLMTQHAQRLESQAQPQPDEWQDQGVLEGEVVND